MTRDAGEEWLGWRAAAQEALYGPHGFYRRPEGPAGHFRTSVHASPLFAEAVARLLCRVDEALDSPATLDFVDMAAGRGELVTAVLAALPSDVAARARGYAVELADRPPGLDHRIEWLPEPPRGVTGLLFANEWLDNVPVDVAEVDAEGVPRVVLVRRDGTERLGEPVAGADAEWLARWWPLPPEEGLRAEIGLPRDEAWAGAVGAVERGLAVAVDYAHTADARPLFGTLTGFRDGRETAPVADGSCDVTAHVALDACARAGERAGTDTDGRTGEGGGAAGPEGNERAGTDTDGRTGEGGGAAGPEGNERAGTDTDRRTGEGGGAAGPEGNEHAGTDTDRRTGEGGGAAGPEGNEHAGTETGVRAGLGAVGRGGARESEGTGRRGYATPRELPRARLLLQREALRALGIAGARPPLALATTQPAAYVRALATAGEAAELTAPGGLGDFGWLLQPVGIPDAAPALGGLLVDVPDDEEQ